MTPPTRTRLKWIVTEPRRTGDPTELDADAVFHYSIPLLDELGDGALEAVSDIGSDKLLLRGGEVLVSKLNPRISRVLVVQPHSVPTLASTEFIALCPGERLDSRFLCYWLQAETTRQHLDGATLSVTRSHQRIRPDVLTGAWLDLPDVPFQKAIADNLDRETARIDGLIAAKDRLVELLEERWATDRRCLAWGEGASGGSDTIQLRRVAHLQAGAAFPHSHQGNLDGALPYVKVGDLANTDEDEVLTAAANRVSAETAKLLRSPILPAGTIVLPKIGAALLRNRRAILAEPSCLDQNVMGATVYRGNPRFVYHCLASIDLGDLSTPGPVPLLNEDAARSVRIPWPSPERQEQVARELDYQRREIASTTKAIARQVKLLAERRRALITAAVTGQLDISKAA